MDTSHEKNENSNTHQKLNALANELGLVPATDLDVLNLLKGIFKNNAHEVELSEQALVDAFFLLQANEEEGLLAKPLEWDKSSVSTDLHRVVVLLRNIKRQLPRTSN